MPLQINARLARCHVPELELGVVQPTAAACQSFGVGRKSQAPDMTRPAHGEFAVRFHRGQVKDMRPGAAGYGQLAVWRKQSARKVFASFLPRPDFDKGAA